MAKTTSRAQWLDARTQLPVLDQRAHQLETFIAALSDGQIEQHELKSQEDRVANLMKEIEPQLDDALHAKITELLCELIAYDQMRMLYQVHQARPKTVFRG